MDEIFDELLEHSYRVSLIYKQLLDNCVSISEEQKQKLVIASLFHDIGKLKLDPKIINKKTKLTSEEYECIKKHPELGCDLINIMIPHGSKYVESIMDAINLHHERQDGKGYPNGIKNIPIEYELLAAADVLDALLSKRSYKEPYKLCKAIEMINNNECGFFSEEAKNIINLSFCS